MNAALAQGLAMRFGTNLRPPMRLAELDLPEWMALALGIALFAAVASPSLVGWYGWHVAMVLAGVYLLAGLSVVHAATRGRAGRGVTLGLLYATLVLFWPAAILVVVLGVIETWARLKRRFGSPGRTLED
jgi:dipeptide/tripeptide permease